MDFNPTTLRQVHHIMGLPISLDLREPTTPLRNAVQQAFDWLREVDLRFSPFRPDSEVSKVSRGELTPDQYTTELTEIRSLCAHYETISNGAFCSWLPGSSFDPNGIVKGWALQRAGQILRDAGAQHFCFNAGGDVLTAGGPRPGISWRVGIRHPEQAHQLCAVFDVRDGAVATSGTYERGLHILNGHTVQPVSELVSLTVVAADLTTADAVSTAAFAMGGNGITWADAQPGCQVFAVDAQHRVYRSAGLVNVLQHETS